MECDMSSSSSSSSRGSSRGCSRTFALSMAALVLLAAVAVPSTSAAAVPGSPLIRLVRSVAETNSNVADMNEIKVCHSTTPCGWAVYVPFTRRVDYFMKNTCECPKDRECLRTDDDLSVSAYVYRCRPADKQDKEDSSS